MPLAVTVKVTLLPAIVVALTGAVTMAGGTDTVSVAAGLVMVPRLFETITE